MDNETWEPQDGTIVNPEEGRIRPGGVLGRRALLLALSEPLFGTTFLLPQFTQFIEARLPIINRQRRSDACFSAVFHKGA